MKVWVVNTKEIPEIKTKDIPYQREAVTLQVQPIYHEIYV